MQNTDLQALLGKVVTNLPVCHMLIWNEVTFPWEEPPNTDITTISPKHGGYTLRPLPNELT